ASATLVRGASPASAIEFAAVLRRCAKAASTAGLTSEISATTSRSKATSADSTRGGGRNTLGETAWKPTFRAESCTSTETAPYAFVLGSAKKRSATSRCTITHQRCNDRACSRDST